MWIMRVPCAGGFMYRLYVNDADHSVTAEGVCFLRNIGWHPETHAFVSTSDDWILWQRGMIKTKGPGSFVKESGRVFFF